MGRFEASVARHKADARVRTLSSKSQLTAMLHAQLSGAVSLRDLETKLATHAQRLYHVGAKPPARSTLADANAARPAAVFTELFEDVLKLCGPGLRRAARDTIHLLDATSIKLTNQSLDWADYEKHGAMLKFHVDYDPAGQTPVGFTITPARVNEIGPARDLALKPGETYVADLGFYDFSWFFKLHDAGCQFVTRLKKHTRPRLIKERAVPPASSNSGLAVILADREVAIEGRLKSARQPPLRDVPLREVTIEITTGKTLRLLTNNMTAPAAEIAALYKARWQIELFFRWIKQNLRIKKFIGTSENAIRIQIAIAMIAYLLMRMAQQTQAIAMTPLNFARLIAANLMHCRPIQNLSKPPPRPSTDPRQAEFVLC